MIFNSGPSAGNYKTTSRGFVANAKALLAESGGGRNADMSEVMLLETSITKTPYWLATSLPHPDLPACTAHLLFYGQYAAAWCCAQRRRYSSRQPRKQSLLSDQRPELLVDVLHTHHSPRVHILSRPTIQQCPSPKHGAQALTMDPTVDTTLALQDNNRKLPRFT